MKKLIVLFLALAVASFAADEAPTMPTEVTLTSGRVLRNVQVVRWETNRVVLKYSGGADPIAFSLIAEPLRSELPAIRKAFEAELKRQKNQTTATKAAKNYDGQAFIVTRGAGNYKLGAMKVYVYLRPKSEVENAFKWSSDLPQADAVTTTDAEGKFNFTAPPDGPVVLVARNFRSVGVYYENYLWMVDAADGTDRFRPLLSSENRTVGPIPTSGAFEKLLN